MLPEINSDQMDPKIYHHTSNVLMQYLVKWTRMYWPTLPAWFVIKDATVKQVALNIRDVDKIDIFSWQTVYEMCSFSTDTRSMSSSPHSLVKNRLFKTAPDIDEPLFQFFHTIDLSLIDMTLLDSPLLLQPFHETFISFWRRTSGTLLKHASFLSESYLRRSLNPIIVRVDYEVVKQYRRSQ